MFVVLKRKDMVIRIHYWDMGCNKNLQPASEQWTKK
jgi:hypothetical protein